MTIAFLSCKNDRTDEKIENSHNSNSENLYNHSENRNTNDVINGEEPFPNQNISDSLKFDNSVPSKSRSIITGIYIKTDEGAGDCSCYCLDIALTGTSRLCLQPNKMYINVKFSQTSPDLIKVYYVNVAETGPDGKKIPFNTFDTNKPIAEITTSGKEIDLNWLGFSVNGDLAIDYAIFGKKTLEGKYKKQ